ncbi:unnamed protein product [Parnassius apollo]|uniref:(apollo) hypothetical protein n=1 Tax=Parnassius apollo TaxID=110799 RepID=A0A8S3Y6N4_PARAO|nr:unnamed protein product [Parnassius apollo]
MTLTNILEHDISTLNVDDLEHIINELTNVIYSACRARMHVKNRGTKPKAPWWTEELEILKREVVDLHHQLHAAKRQGMPLEHILETRKQKRNYMPTRGIFVSFANCKLMKISGHSRTDSSKMPPLAAHQSPSIGAPPTPQTARRLPKHSLTTSTLMTHQTP